MRNQILTDCERKKIRSDLYTSDGREEPSSFKNDKIKFFIKYSKGKAVLDLGSVDHYEGNHKSKHWLFKALASVSDSIVGLDYYEKGVLALREKGFNIVYGDAQNFYFDQYFEVVTAGDLIEHLVNLDGFLKSIRRSLSINGVLVLSTPNPWCWKYFSCHLIRGRLRPLNREHVSWFCIQTLVNLMGRYGFDLIDQKYSSLRIYENLIPLPARIKHTTLNVAFRLKSK